MEIISTNNVNSSSSQPNGEFKQEDYFSIIVAQLKNQDPTSPTDSSEFVNQMIMLSIMEDMNGISKNSERQMAMGMYGKEVGYIDSSGNYVTGIVESIYINEDEPIVEANGVGLTIDQILSVREVENPLNVVIVEDETNDE